MSLEILLFVLAVVAVIFLLAWFAAKWFISRRMAQTEQVLNSSVGALWRAEEAASYLHHGLGTLPFPTLKEQIDQKLAEVETEYTILTRKLGDLRKPFQPHHDPLLKASWSLLNYQWQRYHEAATLGTPIQELKEQIPVLSDLLRKPKYLVALYRRELQAAVQTSLKTAQELVDEGMQGEALASTVRRLEELKSRLDQDEFPFSTWSITEEVSWERTNHAWQTLEAIEASVHELSEEVQHRKNRAQEIKPKLEEMDRKLEVLRRR
jgi:hypothetical protein